jgi:quercetin 2,3-dioxygenase
MSRETKGNTMKKLLRIHRNSEMHWVGNGFPVRSVFDYNGLGRELSPFLLLDYAAPYRFAPGQEKRGVGGHPHKGFETVTIAYQGEVEHRDSGGGGGKIGPGDVQWMTAGRGILHEEFHSREFTRQGGTFQMVQLWVNLRAKDKGAPPAYQTLLKDQIPTVALPHDAGTVRLIAGHCDGRKGPARTFTPINLWDVNLRAGQPAGLPVPDGHTTAALVLSGAVMVNGGEDGPAQGRAGEGDLAIFERVGTGLALQAETEAKLLVMTGEPIAEPIVGYGPFVMNTREQIEQAFEEYQRGRMGELE